MPKVWQNQANDEPITIFSRYKVKYSVFEIKIAEHMSVCLNVKSSPVHRDPTLVTDKTAGFKIPAKQNKK